MYVHMYVSLKGECWSLTHSKPCLLSESLTRHKDVPCTKLTITGNKHPLRPTFVTGWGCKVLDMYKHMYVRYYNWLTQMTCKTMDNMPCTHMVRLC